MQEEEFDRARITSLLQTCRSGPRSWAVVYITGSGERSRFDAENKMRDLLESCGMRGFHSSYEMRGYLSYRWSRQLTDPSMVLAFADRPGRPDFYVCDMDDAINPFFVEVKYDSDDLNPLQRAWLERHPEVCVIVAYFDSKRKPKEDPA